MEPIIASATPSNIRSALHIIRISGTGIFKIVSSCFDKDISTNKQTICVGCIKENKRVVDKVVLLAFPHPNSYTGEDVIEIICHGNPIISNDIISLFLSKGVRLAKQGEFTYRAFLNKKIDLIESEAVNDLINAKTLESKQMILNSLCGKTSSLLKPIKENILQILSNIEVNIDYSEYTDIEKINRKNIRKSFLECKKTIKQFINQGEKGLIIKEGLTVVLVGDTNVGKSTILNTLLNCEKAIVTNIPGTTRDVVEGEIKLEGILLHIFDTAGVRNSNNKIEQIGISKTFKMIEKSDLVIFVMDNKNENIKINSKLKTALQEKTVINIVNKSDLIKNSQKLNKNYIYISAKNKNIDGLINKIKEEIKIDGVYNYNNPSFCNAREIGLLKQAVLLIDKILFENNNNAPMVVLSTLIRELLNIILDILGENTSLDLIEDIFSRFCVGK
ncbi:MAG: tRNA uridine-5-carboxymethylaminomethyl(34) synthesis GTPase MnmE [Bacilli bacterium]|nr:tRNA uridine-5-carboxymethylaminomethyl(34) synthesis GTPase MnmE [Bacilli bacterium]